MKGISLHESNYMYANLTLCCLGQFGLVYKGDWFVDLARKPITVAVKTLKGAH